MLETPYVLRLVIPVLGLLMVFELNQVEPFYIKETGEEFQKMSGDSIQFTCTVSGADFDAFTNIIQWKKSQDYEKNAAFPISQHSQLLENTVFHKTSRFSVEGYEIEVVQEGNQHIQEEGDYGNEYGGSYSEYGQPQEKDFKVILTITDLRPEDSGLYWCEIKDGDSLTHKLEILESVEEVRISGRTDAYSNQNEKEGSFQKYYSNKDGYVNCLSIGGYPDPVLSVYAVTRRKVREDITHFTYEFRNITLVGDIPGLQKYKTYIRRFSDILNLDPMYDQGSITCEGTVDKTVAPNKAELPVVVYSPPMLVRGGCPAIVGAELGDINAELRCQFKANPMAMSVGWLANATELENVVETELYMTKLSGVGIHEYEALFVIKNVTMDSFQYYELTITNSLDTLETAILLKEGYGGSDFARPSLLTMLLSLFTLVVLNSDRNCASSS